MYYLCTKFKLSSIEEPKNSLGKIGLTLMPLNIVCQVVFDVINFACVYHTETVRFFCFFLETFMGSSFSIVSTKLYGQFIISQKTQDVRTTA